nr:xylulose kinase-1 [Tanacetum cinerariifolium]
MDDAKEMWETIKSRFGGNDESKKMQKYLLKQQFEGFSMSTLEGLHKGYDRTKPGLDTLSFDDQYNNIRVFERDVKGHFARDCRAKGNKDSRRRDVGYNGNKTRDNGGILAYQDDSKALVTINGEDIDWPRHVEEDAHNYAMMAYSSSNSGSDNEICWVIIYINPLNLSTVSFGVDAAMEIKEKHQVFTAASEDISAVMQKLMLLVTAVK